MRVGAEAETLCGVKLLHAPQQALHALSDEVLKRYPLVLVLLADGYDEAVVGFEHHGLRLLPCLKTCSESPVRNGESD